MLRRATVVEVGPRDGFQGEATLIPTSLKIATIDAIAAAGVSAIEATSFVRAAVVPQLADAAEVMRGITRRPGTTYLALVPNLIGTTRAIEAGADAVKFVFSATDAGNLKNVGRTVDESLRELQAIVATAGGAARDVHAVIGLAFGCPDTGAVAQERVAELVVRCAQLGIREVAVADSYGYANPVQVAAMCRLLCRQSPPVSLALHLHDTRGMALANILAGLQEGVSRFETSIGGLGGAIGSAANGNAATEDVVHMLEQMGVHTGIDLALLLAAVKPIERRLGRPLPSRLLAAGPTPLSRPSISHGRGGPE